MSRALPLALAALFIGSSFAAAQSREEKVLNDRKKVEAEGFWIYNDFPKGLDEAKKTGKPLLVVLRCVPCVECVKLDDDLIDQDPHVKPLLQKFVCVRIVSTNGLDLSLFQYDYDQSFAALLMNADTTVYGRFGTRSHRTDWEGDVSIQGLARALEAALELHRGYPANKALFERKKGPAPAVPSPENYPSLKGKYTSRITYEKNVVQSCIHCHQIGDAQREMARDSNQPFPDQLLFSYPHPKSQGLILDPDDVAKVDRVEADSSAAKAGFQAGDAIVRLEGQPLLSIADVQWVLHHVPPAGGTLTADVKRGDRTVKLKWTLGPNWRQLDNISWRASTWGLRRMATGGLFLVAATDEERSKARFEGDGMALRAQHVGQYGPHAAAKNAGFQKDDLIIQFDGRTDLLRETDLIAWSLRNRRPGDTVPVSILRAGKRMELKLPLQK